MFLSYKCNNNAYNNDKKYNNISFEMAFLMIPHKRLAVVVNKDLTVRTYFIQELFK